MQLLVGADSEIAAATWRHFEQRGLPAVGTTRRIDRVSSRLRLLDLHAPADDWTIPEGITSACIFAAVARLAACAADPAASAFINVDQTLRLVDRLIERGIHVLFLSTNQVFDGSRPHVPGDAPASPVSEYGRQKARAEAALLRHIAAGAPVGILRLAKIVSPDMALVRGWTEALRARQTIRAFSDMTMAPVPVALTASAIAELMASRERGVFQLTGPADVTYAEVGRHVARRVGAPAGLVEPVPAATAGMPVGTTPRHTTLDSSALCEHFGILAPDAWGVLDPIIQHATAAGMA